MKTTADQFRKLLPTLQHLARFASCNWAAICKRDGVALADVHVVVKEACGSLSLWDEDYLASMAGKLGVVVPPFKAAGLRPAPVADSSRPRIALTVDTAAVERIARDPQFVLSKPAKVAPQAAAAAVSNGRPIKPKFLAIAKALAADPALSENRACGQVGIGYSSWAYFRETRLGKGPLDRAQLPGLIDSAGAPKTKGADAPNEVDQRPRTDGRATMVASERKAAGCTILEQVNAALASYRIEVTALRLVETRDAF